jgi:hypothetical protein
MLLVPRQLQRAGMTGSVPYYGGRFTPAQAYAAAHPRATASLDALRRLRDEGVLTQEEYADLVSRVSR